MSLDIKYRPRNYSDVVGQSAISLVLKKIVESGNGFHQSYLFSGQYGSGKTTLARILARALLCDNPVSGEPCNLCPSCKEILENNSSESLTEVDAATSSGKESIKQMIESNSYSTFTGKKRLWIVDESHSLSGAALDALLKVLEDTSYGTSERRMICIFCTTEPERMKDTIGSRCGPMFTIRPAGVNEITDRLKFICENESIKYEYEALKCISERTSGHIRDAIKLVEILSLLGDVSMKSVLDHYGVSDHGKYLDVLENIGNDSCYELAVGVMKTVPPSVFCQNIAKFGFNCFQEHKGLVHLPEYLDRKRMKKIGEMYGVSMLSLVERFSSKPKRVSMESVLCDLLSFVYKDEIKTIDLKPKTCKNVVGDGKVVCSSVSEPEFVKMLSGRLADCGVKVKRDD